MTLSLQTLALLFLVAGLAAATTPATCPAKQFVLHVTPAKNASGCENVEERLVQPGDASWKVIVDDDGEGGGKKRTTTISLFAGAEESVESDEKGVQRQMQQAQAAIVEVLASNGELKASLALLKEQLQKTNARVEAAELRLVEVQTGAATPTPTTPHAPTKEELRALSEKLLEAAKGGRVEEMRQLMAQGADIHHKGYSNVTALHRAAYSCQADALRLLLTSGADVNATNTYGATPLHWATWANNALCVEALAAAGAPVNAPDKNRFTPLHEAARRNNEGAVRILMAAGADPSLKNSAGETAHDLTSSDGVRALLVAPTTSTTPAIATPPALTSEELRALSEKLLEAARGGCVQEMRHLMAQGADVNHKGWSGVTALHRAAYSCHADALRLLLASGADVNATNNFGATPLHLATWARDALCVETLALAGATINAEDKQRFTPLHEAARRNNEGAVRTLMAFGADPSLKNYVKQTAGDLTSSDGVQALLVAPATSTTPAIATPPALTTEERSALSEKLLVAAAEGRVDEVRQLIVQGADVHFKDTNNNVTALHRAAEAGHVKVVWVLVNGGAPIEARHVYGGTPLFFAAWDGQPDCVEALAAAGADLHAPNDTGDTPLHGAAYMNKEGAVRSLLAAGADPSIRNDDGKKPYDLAKTKFVRRLFPQ